MTVIHETPTTIAYARIDAERTYVEVDLLPRACSSLYVTRVYADGSEHIRQRVKSQRTHLPANVKAAALRLLSGGPDRS